MRAQMRCAGCRTEVWMLRNAKQARTPPGLSACFAAVYAARKEDGARIVFREPSAHGQRHRARKCGRCQMKFSCSIKSRAELVERAHGAGCRALRLLPGKAAVANGGLNAPRHEPAKRKGAAGCRRSSKAPPQPAQHRGPGHQCRFARSMILIAWNSSSVRTAGPLPIMRRGPSLNGSVCSDAGNAAVDR